MSTSEKLSEESRTILALIAEGHSYAQIVERDAGITYRAIFAAAQEALALDDKCNA